MKIYGINPAVTKITAALTTKNLKPDFRSLNFKAQDDVFVSSAAFNADEIPDKKAARIRKMSDKALNGTTGILEEAQTIQTGQVGIINAADKELERVNTKREYILSEIQKGSENDYQDFENDNNRYEFSKDGKYSLKMTMYEYDKNSSKLLRKTNFNAFTNELYSVEEYSKDGTNRYEFASFGDNFVLKISKGVKETDSEKTAKREYSYGSDGALKRFVRDKKTSKKDGSELLSQHYYFSDNSLRYYSQNQFHGPFESSTEKEFEFKNNQVTAYKQNIKRDADGTYSGGETYKFEDNKLQHYSKIRLRPQPDGTFSNDDEHFEYEDGVLYRYYNQNEVINF